MWVGILTSGIEPLTLKQKIDALANQSDRETLMTKIRAVVDMLRPEYIDATRPAKTWRAQAQSICRTHPLSARIKLVHH